jgi:hypothetical protein
MMVTVKVTRALRTLEEGGGVAGRGRRTEAGGWTPSFRGLQEDTGAGGEERPRRGGRIRCV